eukprot:1085484-Amphidinium_carterae.1
MPDLSRRLSLCAFAVRVHVLNIQLRRPRHVVKRRGYGGLFGHFHARDVVTNPPREELVRRGLISRLQLAP